MSSKLQPARQRSANSRRLSHLVSAVAAGGAPPAPHLFSSALVAAVSPMAVRCAAMVWWPGGTPASGAPANAGTRNAVRTKPVPASSAPAGRLA